MTVLVTGATGKVGRHVLNELTRHGIPARAGSRRSEPALDWSDSHTWPAALAGVTGAFIVLPGGDDGHRSVTGLGDHVRAFLDLAATSGVSRLVLMTALGMQYAPEEVEQRAVELHVAGSDLDWTILRPNWFFQNLTEGPLRDLAAAGDGVLRLPAGDAAVSFIDARDIATCATVALAGGTHDLTGPDSLTFADVTGTGRERSPALPVTGPARVI
ncbi:SDR family oxidoreductase [Phytoactinopolyspora endophytica]|uniref:SDR family oxidoreductase n=1 Tax=Phytoactinopolyspora endophytica TaxID=1642495 RepID=UPI0013EB2E17|nr:NAD(P)H-binding protein [Phytoactinopolyspora endophytica]